MILGMIFMRMIYGFRGKRKALLHDDDAMMAPSSQGFGKMDRRPSCVSNLISGESGSLLLGISVNKYSLFTTVISLFVPYIP